MQVIIITDTKICIDVLAYDIQYLAIGRKIK